MKHLSEISKGFALSSKGELVVCGVFETPNGERHPVIVPLDGKEPWDPRWTKNYYESGVSIEIDDLVIEPMGFLTSGYVKPGSLIVTEKGSFISVWRRTPSQVVSLISMTSGFAGQEGLNKAAWCESWSLFGYRKGVLVLTHHVKALEEV